MLEIQANALIFKSTGRLIRLEQLPEDYKAAALRRLGISAQVARIFELGAWREAVEAIAKERNLLA